MQFTFSKAVNIKIDGVMYNRYTLLSNETIIGRYYMNLERGYIEWANGTKLILTIEDRGFRKPTANLAFESTGNVKVTYNASNWAIEVDYNKTMEIDGYVWTISKHRPDGFKLFDREFKGAFKFMLTSGNGEIVYRFKMNEPGTGEEGASFIPFRGSIETNVEDSLTVLAGCYLIENCQKTISY